MLHSKLLCACLFLLTVTPVGAQVVNVPLGAPLPNFQPNTNYNFAPGYQLPPGFGLPSNLIGSVGILVGGTAITATAALQQAICPTCAAGQDAARAAAASGGTNPNFQFQVPPLYGLNVNILDGGVALPVDVGTQTLIQSGSSLMIGSTPPVVGAASGGKPGEESSKTEETAGRGDASGNVSAHASPASKSTDKDAGKNDSEKTSPQEAASPGKVSPVSPSASVAPPSSSGSGTGVPPEKSSPKDPAPAPNVGKPDEPRGPESPRLPARGGDPVVPVGTPKPNLPRFAEPNPSAIPSVVVATPDELRRRDTVAERIDQGMERNVGSTPPVNHRIQGGGIAVPDCMGASREGLACD